MKKKKLTAAEKRMVEHRAAKEAAVWCLRGMEAFMRELNAAKGSNKEREAREEAKNCFFLFGLIIARDEPAKMLRMVAKVFETGELRDRPNIEAFWEAYAKAVKTGNRKAERSYPAAPFPSEIWDAYDKGPDVHWSRPHEDSVSRLARRLIGFGISSKPGRRKKNCHGPE